MKNKLVANDVFYGTTSNCFNLAVGLVMLVTFGMAYPPLAVFISLYLITSTLTMQICLHYHFMQITSLSKTDIPLYLLWNAIVGLELKTINEIIFGVNQSAALLCGCFFCMFFVDMTYTWIVSVSVIISTCGIILFRMYWDSHVKNKNTNTNTNSKVDTNSRMDQGASVDGVELQFQSATNTNTTNNTNNVVTNPILKNKE